MVSRLGDLVVRRNPELAGWAEQQREKYDGLPFQLDEIRPSPIVDAYRNKCEFRVGKQSLCLMLRHLLDSVNLIRIYFKQPLKSEVLYRISLMFLGK